jgi:D-arginine dehydrogenase
LNPRATLFLAPAGQLAAFEALMAVQKGMREIPLAEARRLFPLLRDGYAERAVLDEGTADIDVDLLHQDYLRQFRAGGGTIRCGTGVSAMSRAGSHWHIEVSGGEIRARVVVNAAGAWADAIARMAGLRPADLQPKRRSVAVLPLPDGQDVMSWPLVGDIGETWYAKPQSGKLLVSPADATPVDPHDAYADDMALAEGIDRFQQAADFEVTRLEHSWGGLRTFAPDGNPVCGYDPSTEGFFWLAGQGGYGIQTAPALSRLAAALLRGQPVPADIAAEGLVLADIAPGRFA